MKPIHIGWLYQDLNPGGGQRVCIELSKRFVERGHTVSIIVPNGRSSGVSIPGVNIIETGFRSNSPTISIVGSLAFMLLKSKGFDVLMSSMPFMGILNSWSRNVKLHYHWIQNDDMTFFDDGSLIKSKFGLSLYHWSVKLSYDLQVKYWCNSKWTGEQFKRYSKKNITTIPIGIDEKIFRPAEDGMRQSNLIGIIGRRAHLKGFADAVEALNIVHQKGIELKLRIITQESIDTKDLKFPFEIVSPKDDYEMAKLLTECGIFISSSWFEGFSLPPLEAMGCGTAVITTDSGGCREYAENEFNCLMTPPKDPPALADAVSRLLADEVLKSKLTGNGYVTAQRFTWDKAVDEIERIIQTDMAAI